MAHKLRKPLTDEHIFKSIKATVRKIAKEDVARSDLKIVDTALKELVYTFKIFAPYRGKRKITIFGSARSLHSDPTARQARRFAKEIVRLGYMVLTGAGGGIMQAAQEGAGSENSFGLNIRLPFEQKANPVIKEDRKLIHFKYFFTRKLTMVKESDALVLFPGGFGTQDEMLETLTLLQTGKTLPKPVVCIDKKGGGYWKQWKRFNFGTLIKNHLISKEDKKFIFFTDQIEDAVSHITKFYHNYHSLRFFEKWLLIRVWRLPSNPLLRRLGQKFKDILSSGGIHSIPTHLLPDPEHEALPLKTLRLQFNRKNFGRLRQLIDELNEY
ncbi:MAG: LOG family protein [Deltaproteobacteria bacterium]